MMAAHVSLPGVRAGVASFEVEASRTGRALIEGQNIQLGEAIMPDDLVVVNFDKRHIHTGGGLYLLGPKDQVLSQAEDFTCCRRIMRVPDGIWISNDRGHAVTVQSMDDTCFRVLGMVERVYKPTIYSW